jgi:hypothetical protein
MATSAQIAANQANAQLSTGPKTPAGKARVALNSLDHGFRSQTLLLPGEDPEELAALRAAIFEEYLPEGHDQTRCAEEMTAAAWRIQRARAFQQDILTRKMADLKTTDPTLSGVSLACRAEEELHRDSKYYVSLLRYEAQFDRQYERARRILAQGRALETRLGNSLMQQAMEHVLTAPPQNHTSKPNPPAYEPAKQTPRGAPCPCGSGEKFKRCCGRNAPPVLH